jgi:hypothetical protein
MSRTVRKKWGTNLNWTNFAVRMTTVGRTWQTHPTVLTSHHALNQPNADVSSKPRFSSIGSTDGSRPRNVLKAVAGSMELPTL